MFNPITPFDFGGAAVRTITDSNGDPWFVVKDIMGCLGLTNTTEAVRALDEDELRSESLISDGQSRSMALISESGMYALVLRSNKPEAKVFRKWVTSEVLPQIRKTGKYSVENLSPARQLLHNAQMLVDHEDRLNVLHIEQEAIKVEQQRIAISENETKAQVQALVNGEDYYTVVGYANLHGIKVDTKQASKLGKRAAKLCREQGWNTGKANHPLYGEVNTYPREALDGVVKAPSNLDS